MPNEAMLYPKLASQSGNIVSERFRMALKTDWTSDMSWDYQEFRKIPGPGVSNSTEVLHTYDGDYHRLRFGCLVRSDDDPNYPGNKWWRISDRAWSESRMSERSIVGVAYEQAKKQCEEFNANAI